jgi:Cu(I)/Ag(I) efflux system periplasmic protein CusF
MKTLSSKLLATLGALSVGMSMAVNVQAIDKPSTYPSIAQGAPGPNAAPKTSEMTMGEIQKVDKGANQLTIKHGGIKSLDLPGSTILFTVRDPSILDTVQAGDKVKFKAMSEAGKVIVTEFEVLK